MNGTWVPKTSFYESADQESEIKILNINMEFEIEIKTNKHN